MPGPAPGCVFVSVCSRETTQELWNKPQQKLHGGFRTGRLLTKRYVLFSQTNNQSINQNFIWHSNNMTYKHTQCNKNTQVQICVQKGHQGGKVDTYRCPYLKLTELCKIILRQLCFGTLNSRKTNNIICQWIPDIGKPLRETVVIAIWRRFWGF